MARYETSSGRFREPSAVKLRVSEQRRREAELVAADQQWREAERRRKQAEAEIAEGKFSLIEDTVIPPTPEQLAKGDFVPYTPRGLDGTIRSVSTVRRRLFDSIVHLAARGVLDEDQAKACRWYRDRYEAAQMEGPCGISAYGETIRGDKFYGHLPHSTWAAQARSELRWAQARIARDALRPFHMVVAGNLGIDDAAKACRRRRAWTRLQVKEASAAVARAIELRREGYHDDA
jgi:hypothetical protein